MSRRIVVQRPGMAALVAGGFCAPCVAQEMQQQTQAIQKQWQNSDRTAPEDAGWEGELAFEMEVTGDGRFIEAGALRWEALPIPLRWAPTDVGAHGGAVVIGLIETLSRVGSTIKATGFIDRSTPNGQRAYDLMSKGLLRGVSVDLDEMDVEMRVRKEILDAFDEFIETLDSEEAPKSPERPTPDANGYIKVGEAAMDDEIMAVTDALIRAATLVDIPAFKNAYVALSSPSVGMSAVEDVDAYGLAASGGPVAPPKAWFENPRLSEPTPVTIDDDGRIYGHVALWGTCHTGFANQCVVAPRSHNNYAWFRTGDLVTAEGTHIPVGKITMSTGHASIRLSAAPAAAHYDDTGVVAADVASGEDKHGIWISGSLRSTLTEEQIRELRASPMSGDWRKVSGNLEMVALLAVNMPGFMVPRTRALVASGGIRESLITPVPQIEPSTKMGTLNKTLRDLKLAEMRKGMK
jgi:hypothetical protein